MRYSVRRISLASAARAGCILGGLLSLGPAAGLAWLAVKVMQSVQHTFNQVQPVTLDVFGQQLLRIDLLDTLRLSPAAQQLNTWLGDPTLLGLSLALALLAAGALFWTLSGFVLGGVYNLMARLGLGFSIELRPEPEAPPSHADL